MKKLVRIIPWLGLLGLGLGVIWLLFWKPRPASLDPDTTLLKVRGIWVGTWPQGMANGAALAAFQERHPQIAVRNWTTLRIPGDLDVAAELMSFAGRNAPDVTFAFIHRLQFYVDQGFFHRLNEFIGEDDNGDGVLEPAEVRWKPWLDIPPVFRQMGMRGTDIYALPAGNYFSLMVYRPDLLAAAGIDPQQFPKDFPAFWRACQKICAVSLKQKSERRLYALPRNLAGLYQMFLWSGGGAPGIGDIYGPDGQLRGHLLPEDNLGERAHALGLHPATVTVKWRVQFDDAPTRRALEAIWKLCWQPWIIDPRTGEPVDIREDEVPRYKPEDVHRGVCRPTKTNPALGETDADLLREGEIAMMNNQASSLGKEYSRYGYALVPALEVGGRPAVIAIPMMFGINGDLRDQKLGAAWEWLSFYCGPGWNRNVTRHLLDHGYPELVSPLDVERHGFAADLAQLPARWVEVNRAAMQVTRVIPHFAGYQQAETEFFARTLNKIVDNPGVDIPAVLRETQHDAEERVLRSPTASRGLRAQLFAGLLLIGSITAVGWGIRSVVRIPVGQRNLPATARPRVRWVFWLLVIPAVGSVLVWNYYPALRGLLLAFQEYRLSGSVRWIGLANFAQAATDPRFWYTLWNSIKFIGLNVALGFIAPIGLAVMLHEIPRAKYFFRTVFFLPSVTSSLVIMLLWMVLYEPVADGTLNQVLKPVIDGWNALAPTALAVVWPVRWLQSHALAMWCVVLPGIWAGAGTGCLIYLAALQSVSPDLYEAAEIDGAGFWRKLWNITLPYLRPLLIINLVGAFVGSAHAWSNIFVMTGGGPDLATQVAALEIWVNSFVYLRFGMATAQAWILGALLIGFTVWQIKQMQNVEFRRAKTP